MSLLAIAAGVQAAYGLGQAIHGGIQSSKAKKETQEARDELANVSYAKSSQPLYNKLQSRAQYGLEGEERRYLDQQAERASAIGSRGGDDRRAGLIGLGRQTQRLSDMYRQTAMVDIQEKRRKEEELLSEDAKRAQASYDESSALANLDLAIARGDRQEANRMAQAGLQTALSGGASLAYSLSGDYTGAEAVGEQTNNGIPKDRLKLLSETYGSNNNIFE